MRALLTLASSFLLVGCAGFSGPLIPPNVAWNPQIEGVWDPCPYYLPFQDVGAALNGRVVCTARPLDFYYEDVDQLNLP